MKRINRFFDQCRHSLNRNREQSGVAFFFKQWGGKNKKKAGRELNGRTYDEIPEMELQWSV
ncbi:DUF5131 family protein [Litoribacter populi]|uniref:DUF5131 family protein n=1 Tax=Litoribacter populi TaxID=2598460 RepID=UPI002938EB6F|nr:DUF5131 family protein [Litoribacter populi]